VSRPVAMDTTGYLAQLVETYEREYARTGLPIWRTRADKAAAILARLLLRRAGELRAAREGLAGLRVAACAPN
jgi:hypothetical protein